MSDRQPAKTFQDIDLRRLAAMQGAQRAFVSIYLSGPEDERKLPDRCRVIRDMLADEPDELEHFERNLAAVEELLGNGAGPDGNGNRNGVAASGVVIFSCWALDLLEHHELGVEVEPGLWVGPTPYIRPLAELQEEYENFVVVTADNTEAHVYLVSAANALEAGHVRGEIKNRVKKGGWSQKRYQRRRDEQLHHYAGEIRDLLVRLDEAAEFDRLVLLGAGEALHEIEYVLPPALRDKLIGMDNADPDAAEDEIMGRAFELFFAQERRDERAMWESIKGEYMRNGPAAAGPSAVLEAVRAGRAETILVIRDHELEGRHCRACDVVSPGDPERCPVCDADDLFEVDLINHIVEQAELTSATVDFVDPLEGLARVGGLAAMLRY